MIRLCPCACQIRAKRAIRGEGAIQPDVFCFQVRQLMLASGHALNDTFVFVASDWDAARNATIACLPKGIHANTTSVPVFGINTVSSADDDAIVEMALLSRVNEIIGSHGECIPFAERICSQSEIMLAHTRLLCCSVVVHVVRGGNRRAASLGRVEPHLPRGPAISARAVGGAHPHDGAVRVAVAQGAHGRQPRAARAAAEPPAAPLLRLLRLH